jgi:hypothetical protein
VLKKTSASLGLATAAALFAPLTSSPAYAHANQLRGWHGHHHRSSHHSHHRNRNWNGNRHRARIFIRIYVYNKNNNHAVAVARPERREARPESFARDDGPFLGSPGGVLTAQRAQRVPSTEGVQRADRGVAAPEQRTTDTVPVG